jgi:hypothetical protein
VKQLLNNIDGDLKVPSFLVPKCPVCAEEMSVNLRCDDTFVEDDNWHIMSNKYTDFIENNKQKKVLLLEFGIGFNTPGIIRFPFEEMTYTSKDFKLIRFNDKYASVPKEIKEKSISVNENINEVINKIIENEE